jgi:hypothetical protein
MDSDRPIPEATVLNVNRTRFANALGNAVRKCRGRLSQETQHMLIEKAVICRHHDQYDESPGPQLAEYLHDRHVRTDKETDVFMHRSGTPRD